MNTDKPLSRLAYLFGRYTEDLCTEEERRELMELIGREENAPAINQLIENAIEYAVADRELNAGRADQLYELIMQNAGEKVPYIAPVKKLFWFRRIAVAAIIVLIAGIAALVIVNKNKDKQIVQQPLKNDVLPGGNKAVLTLANGSAIILDNAANGTLAQQGNARVIKTDSGRLAYAARAEQGEVVYNTLTTPRGGQYQLTLPDGSQAWLNAASSIRYPTAFVGNERRVEITGEVYFEVFKNASKPFKVIISPFSSGKGGGEVEVLGTHFNINAYEDEVTISTTLLEGSVKVVTAGNTGKGVVIRPGQQAQLSDEDKQVKIVNNVNLEQVIAWKNGAFSFSRADIQTVMRQLSRWYDVKVQYTGGAPAGTFDGEIGRSLTLRQVLNILTKTRVHYKIEEGKRIVILP